MKNVFKAALLGGVLAFIWSICSWMILPWHHRCFMEFSSEKEVALVLQANSPKKGIYLIPHYEFEELRTPKTELKKVVNDAPKEAVPGELTPLDEGVSTPQAEGTNPKEVTKEVPKKQVMDGEKSENLLAFCSVVPDGYSTKSPMRLIGSFITLFICAFFIAIFVRLTRIHSYFSSVLFTGFLGIISGIIVYLPMMNWFGFSPEFVMITTLDLGATWAIAGVGMSIWTTVEKKRDLEN